MSTDFAIDERTKTLQAKASNPQLSAWVAANAGSGKTFVLARRVIRLLLNGADPSKILCLTFTKAAAAEMSARVFDELAQWATLSDKKLSQEIEALTEKPVNALRLKTARQLFAKALETPGGLKIQTIHAFCERLLHQFPVEANVAGHFEVLDDVGKEHLIQEAQRAVLLEAADHPTGPTASALSNAIAHASDSGYQQALTSYLHQDKELNAWLDEKGGVDGAIENLAQCLGLSGNETEAGLKEQMLDSPHFDPVYLEILQQQLLASTKLFIPRGDDLSVVLSHQEVDARIKAWCSFLLTQKETPRTIGSVASKEILNSFTDLEDRVLKEQERIDELLEKKRALATLDATRSLLLLGSKVSATYRQRKAATGMMDFDDLIEKAAELLEKPDAAAWVHFKLDQGLDHILVDEAQDTSPRQWDVISRLANEFFTGESARQNERTVFAVGDEKQSIYSFQGASPEKFAAMRKHFLELSTAAQKAFEKVPLSLSFRSTADVLDAVDLVFNDDALSKQLTGDYVKHSAARLSQPGFVEIWPPFAKPPELEHSDDWWKPLDRLSEESEKVQLAKRVALQIKQLTNGKTRLEGTGEIITAGDILILSRKRGGQVDAINRALKSVGVPVAGSDRLKLMDNIAILDLLALTDFVLLSEDDLALAGTLKSPLIGFSEQELFRLSHNRRGTLWNELYLRAQHGERPYIEAHEKLDRWRREADFTPPFDFFLNILSRDLGRKIFLQKLGAETEEVLEAFLLQVQTYEQTEVPSLQGFISWFRDGAVEVKRDMEAGRDEVRVMTVHGAKGLEASIVFLVDGGVPYHTSHEPDIVSLGENGSAPYIWKRGKKDKTAAQIHSLERDKQSAIAEYYRLLYVAMTRARDRLYVVSTGDKEGKVKPEGWYSTIADALLTDEHCKEVVNAHGETECWRWQKSDAPARPPKDRQIDQASHYSAPGWLNKNAPAAPEILAFVSPSRAFHDQEMTEVIEPDHEGVSAASLLTDIPPAERGTIMHRLLEKLPRLPASNHHAVAERYLSEVLPDASAKSRVIIKDEVLGVLNDPIIGELFQDENAEAEVTVAGRVEVNGQTIMVRGQIDRLIILNDLIHIVDFKTHRSIPTQGVERQQIERQLALYALVLEPLYPGKVIQTSVLWTAIPKLETLEPARLHAALTNI